MIDVRPCSNGTFFDGKSPRRASRPDSTFLSASESRRTTALLQRFAKDVAATEDFLRVAPIDTRVVTYCGFGGDMPPGYVRLLRERRGGMLGLWVKTHRWPRVASPASGTRLGSVTISALRARVIAEKGNAG